MILVIGNVLDAGEVAALREAAAKLEFGDGKATAGRYAKGVKTNLQAVPSKGREAVFEKVRSALMRHEVFLAAARPKRFARLLVSRYREGMEYGLHVDDPVMEGNRTDLSFTLPLSDAESYEGGGLCIDDGIEERVFRLAAGDAVLYSTAALHRVEPVTRGERLAVVGWVTSRVRDAARREVLYDLDVATRDVFAAQGKSASFDRLFKAKSNLYRMWAED